MILHSFLSGLVLICHIFAANVFIILLTFSFLKCRSSMHIKITPKVNLQLPIKKKLLQTLFHELMRYFVDTERPTISLCSTAKLFSFSADCGRPGARFSKRLLDDLEKT